MSLIPINVAIGLVQSYNQNQAARRAQEEADRREREALDAERKYRDSLVKDFQDKEAAGVYNPATREATARELFRQALDQNLGQAGTEFATRGFRSGDSLVDTTARNLSESNALGLTEMIQKVRDQSIQQRSQDLQATNPAQFSAGQRYGAGYMGNRAQQMQVDPSGLLMSLFNTAAESRKRNDLVNAYGDETDRYAKVEDFLNSGKFRFGR